MTLSPIRYRSPAAGPRTRWRDWQLVGLTALTTYSTAIGWQAQLVSYPLYKAVPADAFGAYHLRYNAAIPLPVIIPGFTSFLAGMAFYWTRPQDVPRLPAAVVGLAGLTSLLVTVSWAIPLHDRLDQIGQSRAAVENLLQANLLRSVALTAATAVLVWCVGRRRR